MKQYLSSCGVLKGVTREGCYKSGGLWYCELNEECQIDTSAGKLVPKYGKIDVRTKNREAISFYETGELKSIYLNKPSRILTSLGEMKAELITFYKDGSIKRVFPTYGQISAYWSEEEEYALVETHMFQIGDVKFYNKVNCYAFYPEGSVKSITLWKGECVNVHTAIGDIVSRMGIAFYKTGTIKSLEPMEPVSIETEIGKIMAYDNNPLGVHGDDNSLSFDEEGKVRSIITVSTEIDVRSKESGEIERITPTFVRSQLDMERWVICGIKVIFQDENIIIIDYKGRERRFDKMRTSFSTREHKYMKLSKECSKCKSCNGCL